MTSQGWLLAAVKRLQNQSRQMSGPILSFIRLLYPAVAVHVCTTACEHANGLKHNEG
jgi:hypothetical protein